MAIRVKATVTYDNNPLWHKGATHTEIVREFVKFIRRALDQGKKLATANTPTGATANLKGTIATPTHQLGPKEYKGEVAWTASYAGTVARGSGPRTVSLAKLRPWSAAVLGDEEAAEAVQRGIQRNGTPSPRNPRSGLNMDDKTFTQWNPKAIQLFESAVVRIVSRLNRS